MKTITFGSDFETPNFFQIIKFCNYTCCYGNQFNLKFLLFGTSMESWNHCQMLLSQVSKIITKLKIFDSISNPKEVKVLIKFWKLQTIFTTFNPKEKVLDGSNVPRRGDLITRHVR